MRPDGSALYCANPNIFTDIYEGAVEPRLPKAGSITDQVLEHTTAIRPFLQTVSDELCENGQIGEASARGSLSFMTRAATSAAVVAGTTSLIAFGVVAGSPVAALGLGAAGLAILPPLAERAGAGMAALAGEILGTFKSSEE
jgi:hypothetical protein